MYNCAVKMLAQIVTDIGKHSIDANNFLCACNHGNIMSHVESKDIGKTLKDAAEETNLQQRSFPVPRAHPNSLRARGQWKSN